MNPSSQPRSHLGRAAAAVVALSLLAAAPLLTAAGEPSAAPNPRQLLAQAKEAAGGTAWDSVRAMRTELAIQAGGLSGRGEVWEDLATGRFTSTFELGPVKGAAGFDGRSVWSRDTSGQVHVSEGEESREQAANEAYLRCFAHFFPERWPATVEYAREEREGERRFHVLAIHPEGGRRFELWLDAATHLPDRTIDRAALETRTTVFSDYRSFEGLVIPFAQRSTTGDARFDQTTTVVRLAINPELSADRFRVPESTATDFSIAGGADSATLPFELLNNHIYVQATIDGKGPLRLLVDTGGANVLTPAAAVALGIEAQGAFEATGAGEGSEEVGLAQVAELRLGGVQLSDQIFYVIPLTDMEKVEGVEFSGLVGFEVFKRFVVTIDYEGLRLSLTRPEAFIDRGFGTVVPFTFNEQIPEVEGSIDGIPGRFTLDTGSRSTLTLHAPFVAEHKLQAKYGARVPALTGWGVGGGVKSYPARAGSLKLGDLTVPTPVIDLFVGEEGSFADRYVAGNVGGGLLKRFTVTFDYARQRLIVVPNGGFDRPEGFDRSGMWINLAGAAFEVMDVVAGGPAAEAGLAVGDRITAIDGRPAGELSLSAVRERLRSEPPGTVVRLTVEGEGGAAREVRLTLRDVV